MNTTDHADVAIKPPFLFLGALAIGCLLSLVVPIGPGLGSANGTPLATGLAFVLIGFALAAWSARVFHLAGTSIVPGDAAAALVTSGPYKVTRNPIYIGFILVYFGLAIILTSMWMLLKVEIADDDKSTSKLVDQLMGNKPEARFRFIQERAEFAKADELDI